MWRGLAYAQAGKAALAQDDFTAARAKVTEPMALNNYCWVKATAGVALESALVDCNDALAKQPGEAAFLDSRAMVELRLGRLDAAIADYDAAITKRPTQSSSLEGRAFAWRRKGDIAKAEADEAAARRSDPTIEATFRGYGLSR